MVVVCFVFLWLHAVLFFVVPLFVPFLSVTSGEGGGGGGGGDLFYIMSICRCRYACPRQTVD